MTLYWQTLTEDQWEGMSESEWEGLEDLAINDFDYDLRSDKLVTVSGSSVTGWGGASGGVSPSISKANGDLLLGFPAIQFSGSQWLRFDDMASVFTGEDPDFTLAFLFRLKGDAGGRELLTAGASSGAEDDPFRVTGVESVTSSRKDDTLTNAATTFFTPGGIIADEDYIVLIKQEGSTRSVLLHRISNGAETSNSGTINVGAATLDEAAIGARISSSSPRDFWNGDIARIRLYSIALTGDLTSSLSGTQLELLKNEMLRVLSTQIGAILGATQSSFRSAFYPPF